MIFWIPFLIFLNSSQAQTCPANCSPTIQSRVEKESQLVRVKSILEKNEEYLKKNPQASPSISVKVRSNILMSKLQIETIQNQMLVIDKTIESQGCKVCKATKSDS